MNDKRTWFEKILRAFDYVFQLRLPDRKFDEELISHISEVRTRLESVHENLPQLYSERMEWARHFNEMVWSIGTIMLPLSFAGFAVDYVESGAASSGGPSINVVSEAKEVKWTRLGFVAAASIGLLIFWIRLGDWHRRLWVREFVLTDQIEYLWRWRDLPVYAVGRDVDGPSPSSHLLSRMYLRDEGNKTRFLIARLGIIAWIVYCLSYLV